MLVKQETIRHFMAEHMLNPPSDAKQCCRVTNNPYHDLGEKIYLRKSAPVNVGDVLTFEYEDSGQYSGKSFVCRLSYVVTEYDDMAMAGICREPMYSFT